MTFRPFVTFATIAAMSVAFGAPIPPQAAHTAGKPIAPKPAVRVVVKAAPTHKVPAHKALAHRTPAKGVAVKNVAVKKPIVKTALPKKYSAKGAKLAYAGWPQPKPATRIGTTAKAKTLRPLVKKPFAVKPLGKTLVSKKAAVASLGAPARLLAASIEKKTIQAKYDQMSLLVMRRDGNKLATLLMGMTTPDFVYRDKKGHAFNRAKLISQLKAQMKMVKSFKRSGNKVASFAAKGSIATVRVISDFAMIFPSGKKNVTVEGQSTTDDTWIKTAKGWKLRQIRTLRESVKYNGKPM